MKVLDDLVAQTDQLNKTRKGYRSSAVEALAELKQLSEDVRIGLDAQRILSTVSDERTDKLLSYVTQTLNHTLAEIFPKSRRTITLEKKLFGGKHPHINVKLEDGEGDPLDLSLASGAGIGVVVSLLYRLCLIEVKGDRKILIADELLHGLHPDAMKIVLEIIKIFANQGFQFIFIEYVITGALGKMYRVSYDGTTTTVSQIFEDDLKTQTIGVDATEGIEDDADFPVVEDLSLRDEPELAVDDTLTMEDDD